MVTVSMLLYALVAIVLLFAWWWNRREALRLEAENAHLQQEKRVVVEFMHRMATALDDSPSRDLLMQRIVRAALDSTEATSACLYERVGDDQLRGAAVEGLFPPHRPIVPDAARDRLATRARFLESVLRSETLAFGEGVIGQVAATGRAELVREAAEDARIVRHNDPALAIRSFMAVPLLFNHQCFGVLALTNPATGRPFGQTDFELVSWIGEQAAVALHNADFLNLHIEKQQIDLDLALASNIQQMILPSCAPRIAGLDIDLRYAAAQKVGGDLYDIIEYSDGRLGVAIADVSGKGVPASLLMAMCRSYLRQIAPRHDSPSRVLAELNQTMLGDVRPGMFVTLIYAIIDPGVEIITYARAGHELPLMVRRVAGEGHPKIQFLESEGMPIGLVPDDLFSASIADGCVEFRTGDVFMLYTDGITEAPNEEDGEFSGARLADVVRGMQGRTAREVNDAVLETVTHFIGSRAQRDDYTLVTARRL